MADTKDLMRMLARTKGRRRPRAHPKAEPPIKQQEREYVRQMLPIMKALKDLIDHHLIRKLPDIVRQYDAVRPDFKRDAADDEIKSAMKAIRLEFARDFTKEEIESIAAKRGITVARLNKEFLDRGVRRVLDIDVFANQPYVKSEVDIFATQNANLITSMGDEYLSKVENLAYNALADGVSVDEIQDQIMDLVDPDKVAKGNVRARAELIARDQVGKLNGQLSELRQTEIGVKRYVWRTVGDERVREMHRDLNGQTFDWDDPPITNSARDRNHPGGDYQCRCWAEPVLSDLVSGVDDQDEE